MKNWIKYLIGLTFGVLAAVLLPFKAAGEASAIAFVSEMVVRLGRYTLLPLLFFSSMMAFYKMHEENALLKTTLLTFSTIILSSLLLTLVGFVLTFVRLPRIAITREGLDYLDNIDVQELFRQIVPYSAFQSLSDGAFLLPLFLFSLLIGAGCFLKHPNLHPILSLFESLSELFYNVTSVLVDLFSIGIIAVSCYWTIQLRESIANGTFTPLILMLCASFIIIIGIIYPVILKLMFRNTKPFKILYASLVPFLAALLSGDTNFALPFEMKTGKDLLGIRRRTNAFAFPFFSIFARGGSALVMIICFVTIRRSYSDLPLNLQELVRISLMACALSFTLGNIPVGGTFTALTALCTFYGRGMDAAHLLLRPAALIISSFAALIDVATAMFGCYIVAYATKTIERKTS